MGEEAPERLFESLNMEDAPHIVVDPPGPKTIDLIARQKESHSAVLMYANVHPFAPDEGRGATMTDVDGNVFLDFNSGSGVLSLGHSLPDVVAAVQSQVAKMAHALDYPAEPRVELAERLREVAPGDMRGSCKVFFTSPSGSEAVEAAVKLAKYHSGKPGIISFEGSWHGTSGTGLALTGKRSLRQPYLPLTPETYQVPYAYCYRCRFGLSYPSCDLQCAAYVEHLIKDPDSGATNPGVLIIEPVQNEAGAIVPPDGYLAEIRRMCSEAGIVMIVDEVFTGFGRTGSLFASDAVGITPDIMVFAKAVGGGIPTAGILIGEEFDTWTAGMHAGTFRGNLLSCAAGLAALNFIERTSLASRAARLGMLAMSRFSALAERSRVLGDVRGKGLLMGIEFVEDKESREPAPTFVAELVRRCFQRGVYVYQGGAYKNVLRMAPALVISENLLDRGVSIIEEETLRLEAEYQGEGYRH